MKCRAMVAVFALAALPLAALPLAAKAAGPEAGIPSVVVELFTSQGCSSCPPADKLADAIADRPGVLALTMPVDYWDALGWIDTLASPAFTARQRSWALALNGSMYTPQMVIHGQQAVVGSKRRSVEAAIRRARQTLESDANPTLTLDRHPDTQGARLRVSRVAKPPKRDAAVTLYCYPRSVDVLIERGENAGRRVTYAHPVRLTQDLGFWSGSGRVYPIDLAASRAQGCDEIAVVVQSRPHAPPLAAARWRLNLGT